MVLLSSRRFLNGYVSDQLNFLEVAGRRAQIETKETANQDVPNPAL